MSGSSQKIIGLNRAMRVQIEYDVELYGAEKKVNLPFVMGVVSDFACKSNAELPPVDEGGFMEVDSDNFDDRMKSMKPPVVFSVPNVITDEGSVDGDLMFNSMEDFNPDAAPELHDASIRSRTRGLPSHSTENRP